MWYPLLAGNPHERLVANLAAGGIRRILIQELRLFPDAPGLRGSGLLWAPPHGSSGGFRNSRLASSVCSHRLDFDIAFRSVRLFFAALATICGQRCL